MGSYQLILKNIGNKPIDTLRLITAITTIDNQKLNSILNSSVTLLENLTIQEAKTFTKAFEDLGAHVEITKKEEESSYSFDTYLLFPIPPKYIAAMYDSYEDFYYLTHDGSLMYYRKSSFEIEQNGCERVYQDIPVQNYTNFEIGRTIKGSLMLLMHNKYTNRVELINLTTRKHAFPYITNHSIGIYPSFIYINNDYAFYFSENKFVHSKYTWDGEDSENWGIDYLIGEDNSDHVITTCNLKLAEIQKVKHAHKPSNLLESVSNIYIDEYNNLIFSSYCLTFSIIENKSSFEVANPNHNIIKQACRCAKNKFIFENGSEIFLDKDGIIILISRYSNVSNIYLVATLDETIGMATDKEFAGNEYYAPRKKGKYFHHNVALHTISLQDFKIKYIDEFISDIVTYSPNESKKTDKDM